MQNISNKQNLFLEIVGWYGTGAIVLAYALVSFSVLNPTDLIYQLLNLTGGGRNSHKFACS